MEFKTLIMQFAKSNNLNTLKEESGRYTLVMGGQDVYCYSRNKCVWLETDLGKIAHDAQQLADLNKLLLTRSIGFVRDERACLSIDEETQRYSLHQRIALAHITPQAFQKAVEQFGGCYQYIADLIKQHAAGRSSEKTGTQV